MKETDKKYEIPKGGSLGLLALGDIGLLKWREKRKEVKDKIENIRNNKRKAKDNEQKDS